MVIIEILDKDKEMVKEFEKNANVDCLSGHKFQGDPETIKLLIDLAKVSIPALAGVVVAFINSRKYIAIKHNGIEVKGIKKKNALKILEKLYEEEKESNE